MVVVRLLSTYFELGRDYFEQGRVGHNVLALIQYLEFRKLSATEDICYIIYHTDRNEDLCLTMGNHIYSCYTAYKQTGNPFIHVASLNKLPCTRIASLILNLLKSFSKQTSTLT
jgi:hypothetical protein